MMVDRLAKGGISEHTRGEQNGRCANYYIYRAGYATQKERLPRPTVAAPVLSREYNCVDGTTPGTDTELTFFTVQVLKQA